MNTSNNDCFAHLSPPVRTLAEANEQREKAMFANKVHETKKLMDSRVTASFDDLWNDISNFIDTNPTASPAEILAELANRAKEAPAQCKDSLLYCVFGREAELLGVDLSDFREIGSKEIAPLANTRQSAADSIVKRGTQGSSLEKKL